MLVLFAKGPTAGAEEESKDFWGHVTFEMAEMDCWDGPGKRATQHIRAELGFCLGRFRRREPSFTSSPGESSRASCLVGPQLVLSHSILK